MEYRRLWAVGVLLLATGCPTCRGDASKEAPAKVTRKEPPAERQTPKVSPPKTLEEARERRRAAERLPPDGRFLRALEDLSVLIKGGQRPTVAHEFVSGKWHVSIEGAALGEIPETADFSVLQNILVAQAKALGAGKVDEPLSPMPPQAVLLDEELVAEENAVNAAWSSGWKSPGLASRAAHAAASRALQMFDEAGVGDAVTARAWALHAIARAVGGGWNGDEALLAQVLGHTRAARQLASGLPAGDPIRSFVSHDDAALRKLANEASPVRAVSYLWMLRLAEIDSSAEMEAFSEKVAAFESQAFTAALTRQGTLEMLSIGGMASVLLELRDLDRIKYAGAATPTPTHLSGHVLRRFESLLSGLPERGAVPFDTELVRVGSRARLYTALERMQRARWERGIPEEVNDTFGWLGVGTGQSAEVLAWLKALVRGNADETIDAMTSGFPHFGASAFEAVCRRHYAQEFAGDWNSIEGARQMLRHMDARPADLKTFAEVAWDMLADGDQRARLGRRWLQVGDDPWMAAWIQWWDGSADGFVALAADETAPATARYDAVLRLLSDGVLTEDVASKRLRAILGAGDDIPLWKRYADWLRKRERWDELIAIEPAWLKAHADDRSLQVAHLRTDLARALWMKGRGREASEVMRPALTVGSALVFYEAACAALADGRREEALKLADRMGERYGRSSENYAGILWRAGESQKAAEALKTNRSHERWKVAGQVFANAFRKTVSEESEKALQALIQAAPQQGLPYVAQGMIDVSAPALATQLLESLPPGAGDGPGSAEGDVVAYKILKKLQKPEAVAAWVSRRDHHADAVILAQAAYLNDADDLLFTAVEPPMLKQNAPLLWLYRVNSVVRRHLTSGPQFETVRTHYEKNGLESKSDWSMPVGRYLLGLDHELSPEVSKEPSTTAVVMAIKAEGEGDLVAAADWYRDVIEFGGGASSGGWAWSRLHQWYESGRPLRKAVAAKE